MPEDIREVTKRYYDRLIEEIGDGYIDYRWRQGPVQRSHYTHTRKALEWALSRRVGRVDRLLEVGCGPGTWTDLCRAHSRHLTLCDISQEMIRLVRRRYGASNSVDFVCGDFEADAGPLGVETFDAIVSVRAIEYMGDKAAVVDRSRAHLVHGGHLVLITKNPRWGDKRRAVAAQARSGKRMTLDAKRIQSEWIYWRRLAGMLEERGFDSVSVMPVAVGSFRRGFRNRVGVALSDLVQRAIWRRSMRPMWDYFVESYMICARRI